ncbi:PIN domain-containing protein [Rathayibacter soli]|uniref:PIN domain-containing protein n=1 Tax=Rathayibacter soli TaxID=3144168 RepID=UPI0027E3CE24|nr:PIN domain-containing protein [Glaciibacter superstes]
MVQLVPGASLQSAIAALEETSRTASNIFGAGMPVDRLNEYRTWSTRQIRSLTGHLTSASIEELVATRRHWLLQSLDPIAYGVPAVGELVDLELATSREATGTAVKDLRGRADVWSKWAGTGVAGAPFPAVVLDTNVLLRHAESLIDVPWHLGLNVFPHVDIALGIPMIVVEELDRLKDSNGVMYIGEEKLAVRTLARTVLRSLDKVFQAGYLNWQIRQRCAGGMQLAGELHAILMVDDLHHERMRDADLEIIDQAIRLRPFTADVALATYDQAMIFRARNAGLKAFRPIEES